MSNYLVKPFLKWAGGKRQLIKEIKNYIPKYTTYYEPFLGGGAILFALQPKQAVINDSNEELINCYRVIKDSVEALIEDLRKHKNESEYYYDIRQWDRNYDYEKKSSVERASRLIFLNKTCYNGLFRVNSQGQFNVPFGKYKNPNILEESLLISIHHYLNNNKIEILNTDFKEAVKTAKQGDFVYFDPPYDPLSDTAYFTAYDINCFNQDEQKRLKLTVDDLTRRKCQVLLSNADTPFIRELYKDYKIVTVSASRFINSNKFKRGKVNEVLVINDHYTNS
ncbi:DNA adenine methylase [Gloeothece citriformis PCC 7424]|uniref:Site-specific DNA-methyltransferase (adenine-specific) n=1 Tax=Gloeothece citriformis (strain PCC 7424) TaxID=65393 RepID=B7KL08_GLOC7|nr:DNA adenine methylase [Gloeothece citriformis]ACK72380.1 DNA adenine methylase [Gloeothece citriformis PCC 7424]